MSYVSVTKLDGGRRRSAAAATRCPSSSANQKPPSRSDGTGSLVGVLDEPKFSDTTIELQPGDVVVVYTDGVTEARSPHGEFYGDDRLATFFAIHGGSATALADSLLKELLDFQSGQPRDDIAFVTVAMPNNPSDQLVQ